MITITLTMASGNKATIADGEWQSADRAFAAYLNKLNETMGEASHQPHPYLHVAEFITSGGAGTFECQGEDDGEAGDIH